MAGSPGGRNQSSRRSCENCRRKKTKCTGEKPTCSFCQRLRQQCYYLPRDGKKHQDSHREAHEKVKALNRRCHLPSGVVGRNLVRRGQLNCPSRAVASAAADTTEDGLLFEFLDVAISAYGERMNFQPISLFCPRTLRETFSKAPRFLQWTFLSLSIMYLGGDAPELSKREAIKSHAASARVAVTQLAAEANPKLEVSQCLCLIALAHILAGEGGLAWMTLGLATRLEVMRISQPEHGKDSEDREASSRCYWSIRCLENGFAPESIPRLQDIHAPAYPSDMETPRPVNKGRREHLHELALMDDECIQGSGIFAHSIRVMSSWRDVNKWLHDIRHGSAEKPWLPTSRFAEVTQHLYELENNLDYKHCFRNARLPDRSLDELHRDQEYWRCWIMYHVRFHACFALLNHPFVHLVALRNANRSPSPRSFLQIVVDQALYHSSWVIRLINMCIEIGFDIHDPFTSDIVVAVATVPWIMQYARDQKVATRAEENLSQCRNFLSTLSQAWPRVVQKLATLDQLQSMTDCATSQNTISFKPAQLWQLLDPSITELSAQRNTNPHGASDQSTTMRVHTTFIHPLIDEEANAEDQGAVSEAPFSLELPADVNQQFLFDDFFLQPLHLDQTWLDIGPSINMA
ncbi:hypothetical protein KJ359_009002 [Pestalotiopsis sp. 9143b]|nr:hypothetical protein KJ359_009002 [Pestalotiopsis sp. 9143b]